MENDEFVKLMNDDDNYEIVKYVVENGYDPSWNNSYAVLRAASHNSVKILKYLLTLDTIDTKALNSQNIFTAPVMYGYIETVKILLADKRFDPTISKNAIMYSADLSDKKDKMTKLLLKDERIFSACAKFEQWKYLPDSVKDIFIF